MKNTRGRIDDISTETFRNWAHYEKVDPSQCSHFAASPAAGGRAPVFFYGKVCVSGTVADLQDANHYRSTSQVAHCRHH